MNEKQIVDVGSGEVFTPGFVAEDNKKFWFSRELKLDRTPDRRSPGHHIVINQSMYGYSGRYAIFNAEREALATPVRNKIADLRAQVLAAEIELGKIYQV